MSIENGEDSPTMRWVKRNMKRWTPYIIGSPVIAAAFFFLLLFARGADWHDHPRNPAVNVLFNTTMIVLVAPGLLAGYAFPNLAKWHDGFPLAFVVGLMWGAVLIWLIRKLYSRIWKHN